MLARPRAFFILVLLSLFISLSLSLFLLAVNKGHGGGPSIVCLPPSSVPAFKMAWKTIAAITASAFLPHPSKRTLLDAWVTLARSTSCSQRLDTFDIWYPPCGHVFTDRSSFPMGSGNHGGSLLIQVILATTSEQQPALVGGWKSQSSTHRQQEVTVQSFTQILCRTQGS